MTGLVLSATVTGQRRAEQAVRLMNAELEERVRLRTLQLQEVIEKLQKALTRIRTLSGLVPICGWCKNIRDDQGFWQHLETYLKDHTEAEFTHSMCPICYQKQIAKLPKSSAERTGIAINELETTLSKIT